MPEDTRKVWQVREWYRYGKWNAHVARTRNLPATSRVEAKQLFDEKYGKAHSDGPNRHLTANIIGTMDEWVGED